MTYHNIANLHYRQKRYALAKQVFEKSLYIKKKALGEDHHDVAYAYHSLGELERDQGHWREALSYYQKALVLTQKNFKNKGSIAAGAFQSVGLVYEELHKKDSAAYFHQQALKAIAPSFESDALHDNPEPTQALEKNMLMNFLEYKAQVLVKLGQQSSALRAYKIAADCARLVMFEAQREQDKLDVAARAHSVHTQAAHLHFLVGKKAMQE